ncbi:MAG: hypothetical protein HYV37_00060 [Candidatus Levyibacteriota bacterium]|nr:MAG: hypothetical protein HYV37_00060 [Candidatus Levybacteria bacterium]
MAKIKPLKFFKRKKKEVEPEKKKNQVNFPSIYRFIPAKSFFDKTFWKWIIGGFIALLLVIMFVISSIQTYKHFQDKKLEEVKRKELILKVEYWEKVINKYKNYRDGYFQLAVLEYQLGNKEKAKMYLDKVFLLDPNFEEGQRLKKLF